MGVVLPLGLGVHVETCARHIPKLNYCNYRCACITIRPHGSAVYVGMVVIVCIPKYNGKPPLSFLQSVETGRIQLSRRKYALYRRQ